MDSIVTTAQENKDLIKSVAEPLAVIGLEKAGYSAAGKLLTPAIWFVEYGANGKTPDTVSVGLYGLGLAGGVAAPAAIATGIFKGIVDDDLNQKLKRARSAQDETYRPHIKTCYSFSSSPAQINAMKIAKSGGTAWKHENGLWVYITDAKGRLISNFKPKGAKVIYRPVWPLESVGQGNFRFTQER